ncbi:uncharacterized protein LOC141731091 [Zonotrichia albicollis]|uniref:uncharacterized protein LOC141731091 n=1 Tax=Zonotrichia albicollis TaxID=44394 RepID=UPI003D8114DE
MPALPGPATLDQVRRGPAAPPPEPAPRRPPCPPALLPRSDMAALAPHAGTTYGRPAPDPPAAHAAAAMHSAPRPPPLVPPGAARLPREERGLGAPPGTTFPAEGSAVVRFYVMASGSGARALSVGVAPGCAGHVTGKAEVVAGPGWERALGAGPAFSPLPLPPFPARPGPSRERVPRPARPGPSRERVPPAEVLTLAEPCSPGAPAPVRGGR